MKGIIRERRGTEREKLERETNHETPNSGKRTKVCGRGSFWGDGLYGDRH